MGDLLAGVEAKTPGDTRAMRWHWSTVCADTLAEVEAETKGNRSGAAQPLLDDVATSRAEEDVETQGDTLSDATHWSSRCQTR